MTSMRKALFSFLVTVTMGLCLAFALQAQQMAPRQVEASRVVGNNYPCVVVIGAVPAAKRVALRRPLRLMEVLFLAGGLTEGAGEVVKVAHGSPETSCAQIPSGNWEPNEQEAKPYRIADLKRDEESANPFLQPGDTVVVERLPSVGVVGCVAGGRWFYTRKPITLTRAVTMAGGPVRNAHRVTILRQNPPAPDFPLGIEADLDLIKKGKAADPLLQDGDTVEVFRKEGDMCGVHIDW